MGEPKGTGVNDLYLVRDYKSTKSNDTQHIDSKKFGSSGGNDGGGGMDKDYVDAKIDSSNARTDLKIGQIHSDLQRIEGIISQKPGLTWLIALTIASVFAVLTGLATMLQFSNEGFDTGFSTSSAYAKELEANRIETNKRLDSIEAKTDEQIDRLEKTILNALSSSKERSK